MRCKTWLGAVLLVFAIWAPGTDAVAYPDRPVRVIVPFPPGGGTDVVGRIIAERLSETLGKQFVVENRSGAGAMLGADQVAKATPDGHTILVGTSAEFTISPALFASVPYKPVADFTPIALLGVSPVILLANPKFPANDCARRSHSTGPRPTRSRWRRADRAPRRISPPSCSRASPPRASSSCLTRGPPIRCGI